MRRVLLVTLGIAACGSEAMAPLDDFVFLSMSVEPAASMDALFRGRISADDAGCLRLESSEPATVIWPKGYSLGMSVEGVIVRNAAGIEIGRIDDTFELGGGYVASLDGIGTVSARTRQLAHEKCPGKYWIAGGSNQTLT